MERAENNKWPEKPESPAAGTPVASAAPAALAIPGPLSHLLTPTAPVTHVVTPAGLRPPDWSWQLGLHLARGQRVPRKWVGPAALAARDAARALADAAGLDLRETDAEAALRDEDDCHARHYADDPLADLRSRSPDAAGSVAVRAFAPKAYRWEVEARVLAGQTPDRIAAATGLPAAHVRQYEAWFFDVRGRLAAKSYVMHQVIRWFDDKGDRTEKLWKFFAYRGGPLVLEAVICGRVGGDAANATVSVGDAFDRDVMNALLVRAACAVHTAPAGPAHVRWMTASLAREARAARRPPSTVESVPFSENVRVMIQTLQGYATGATARV